jgi:hypothetical protein
VGLAIVDPEGHENLDIINTPDICGILPWIDGGALPGLKLESGKGDSEVERLAQTTTGGREKHQN